MKIINFQKMMQGALCLLMTAAFFGCTDDNKDTEAPYLEVSPATLAFDIDGTPADDNGATFNISTNRAWAISVQEGKDWVTLSAYEGEGSASVQVSIPEGINDKAILTVEVSNKTGVLYSQAVTIESGDVTPPTIIYRETVGDQSVASPWPYVDTYTGWNTSGDGASGIVYSGQKATIRNSGLSNSGTYDGASGPNVVFFGTLPADFTVGKIALTTEQTKLKLSFGGSYSFNDNGTYINIFDVDNFTVEISGDGVKWTRLDYTKSDGDAETPYWIQATANFTLSQPSAELYIKFTALTASVYRLDDITLTTGAGGTVINLDDGIAPPPSIVSVSPASVDFPAAGGNSDIIVTMANQGSETLSVSGLSGILSASVTGTDKVTVVATANADTSPVNQSLTISLSNGNSIVVPVSVAGDVVVPPGTDTYTCISTVASLTAGTYLMAGFLETSSSGTDLKPYSYHVWTGAVSYTGSGTTFNSDLVTVAYQYSANTLTPKESTLLGAEIELVAVPAKTDTYYIKSGTKYLYSSVAATNRRLYLQDTADAAAEWEFMNKSNGDGVTASNNDAYLITALADSNFLRTYKTETQTKIGLFFFKKN